MAIDFIGNIVLQILCEITGNAGFRVVTLGR